MLATTPEAGGQRLAPLYTGRELRACRGHLRRSRSLGPSSGRARERARPAPMAANWTLQPGLGARLLTLHQPVPGEGGGTAGNQRAGDSGSHRCGRAGSAPAPLPPWAAPLRRESRGDAPGTRSGRGRALGSGASVWPSQPPSAPSSEARQSRAPRCYGDGCPHLLEALRRRPYLRSQVPSACRSHGAG